MSAYMNLFINLNKKSDAKKVVTDFDELDETKVVA